MWSAISLISLQECFQSFWRDKLVLFQVGKNGISFWLFVWLNSRLSPALDCFESKLGLFGEWAIDLLRLLVVIEGRLFVPVLRHGVHTRGLRHSSQVRKLGLRALLGCRSHNRLLKAALHVDGVCSRRHSSGQAFQILFVELLVSSSRHIAFVIYVHDFCVQIIIFAVSTSCLVLKLQFSVRVSMEEPNSEINFDLLSLTICLYL